MIAKPCNINLRQKGDKIMNEQEFYSNEQEDYNNQQSIMEKKKSTLQH